MQLLGNRRGEHVAREHHGCLVSLELDRECMVAKFPSGTMFRRLVCRDPAAVDEYPFEDRDVADELLKCSGLLVQGGGSDECCDERFDRGGP